MPAENKITVWTPVFNGEKTLERCIKSVLEQSEEPFEYIILDDCSNDNSLEIANRYAQKYSWIEVVENDKNRGAIANFNRILKYARGDYLYAVAADDFTYENAIANFSDAIKKWPNVGVVFGKLASVDEAENEIHVESIDFFKKTTYISPKVYAEEYLNKVRCNHSLAPSSVFKKNVLLETNGYIESLGHWSDSFLQRYAALKYGSVYIPTLTHAFTNLGGSLSGKAGKSLQIINYLEETTKLMKSAKYRKYFPLNYIKTWEKDYRYLISKSFYDEFQLLESSRNHHLSYIISSDKTNAITKSLLSFFIKFDQLFIDLIVKQFCKKFLRIYSK